MTWAFGLYFSLAIGTSDFFGAYLARRAQAFTVVISFLRLGRFHAPIRATSMASPMMPKQTATDTRNPTTSVLDGR